MCFFLRACILGHCARGLLLHHGGVSVNGPEGVVQSNDGANVRRLIRQPRAVPDCPINSRTLTVNGIVGDGLDLRIPIYK